MSGELRIDDKPLPSAADHAPRSRRKSTLVSDLKEHRAPEEVADFLKSTLAGGHCSPQQMAAARLICDVLHLTRDAASRETEELPIEELQKLAGAE